MVLTLDVGGALAFRAQGDPKGRAFGDHVNEIDTLRSDPNNPHARHLFGDMSVAALRSAIEVVLRMPDEHIRELVLNQGGREALATRMLARKNDLARRYVALA